MLKCLYVQIKYWCYVTSVISHSRDIATATNATLYSSCFPSSSHCFIFHKVCCFLKTEKHCKREWNATLKKKREVQTHWFAWKFRFRDTFLPFPAWTPSSIKTPALTHYWIPILKAKTIFEASKDHKSTGYPAWMEIRRIKRLGALSLHYQGYKPKNYWLLNLWNLSLHRSIRIWKHNWVVRQKESSWVVTPCECHGYCSLGCVSNRRGMRLVESQFWGFFFLS